MSSSQEKVKHSDHLAGSGRNQRPLPALNLQTRKWLIWGVLCLPIIFFVLFYFYPLTAIIQLSFSPDGYWDANSLSRLYTDSFFARTLWFTTWQATVSTLLTIGLALPGAYVFARYEFWGKQSLKAISTLPFVLPTVVVASAFTAFLGPNGIVNDSLESIFGLEQPPIQLQFTIWMILLAHVFYNYSVALRMISSYWQNLPRSLEQAAVMLGASPIRVWREITFPMIRPAIWAAAVIVFIFSFTSFGVVLILGGPRFSTIETEIYRQAVNTFNLPIAAALSLIQIVFTFGLMWLYTRTQSRLAHTTQLQASDQIRRPIRTLHDRLIVGSNVTLMIALLGLPLFALVYRSFDTRSGLSLAYYRQLWIDERNSIFFVPPAEAIFNSLGIALVAMVMAVVLGVIGAILVYQSDRPNGQFRWLNRLKRLLDPLFMLPLATSAVTLGFGYIIALNTPPLNLRKSLILVPIAHTLVAIPFVMRAVLPAIRRIPPSLREAAGMLGARPGQVWREIDWPLIRRPLLVGAVFAFTVSMGEFGATVFIARPQSPTMPVVIERFLGQPGSLNYGQALAMSTLLMLVCAVGFVAIERFRLGDEGEF